MCEEIVYTLVVILINFSSESTMPARHRTPPMAVILAAYAKFQTVIVLSSSPCVLAAFKQKALPQAWPRDMMRERRTAGQLAGMPCEQWAPSDAEICP